MKNVEKKIEMQCFATVNDFIAYEKGVCHVFAYTKKGWFILRYVGNDKGGHFYVCTETNVKISDEGDINLNDPSEPTIMSKVPIKKELITLICLLPTTMAVIEFLKSEKKEVPVKEKVGTSELPKPLIGIIPTYIWKEERVQSIRKAMRLYLAEDKIIPANWLNELTDLYIDLDYS